jgi:N-acetylglutamate synthase-like GNAT family acetyltransferase
MRTVRPALPGDADAIIALVSDHARRGEVLPRRAAEIVRTLDDWIVGEDDGRLCACGSLRTVAPDRAEIRSVVVADGCQGNGWGGRVVEALIVLARERRIGTVYALTHAAPLFQRAGFTLGSRADWPEKVYGDCAWCSRREGCQQTAVVLFIERTAPWQDGEHGPSSERAINRERLRVMAGDCKPERVPCGPR